MGGISRISWGQNEATMFRHASGQLDRRHDAAVLLRADRRDATTTVIVSPPDWRRRYDGRSDRQAAGGRRMTDVPKRLGNFSPGSMKFGGLQAQLSLVDLPPEGGPATSRSRPVTTPRRDLAPS
jgi:hypothetical protein